MPRCVQSRSTRRRRKQSAADAGAEHVQVDRELWELLFSQQRMQRASRKSERGAPAASPALQPVWLQHARPAATGSGREQESCA